MLPHIHHQSVLSKMQHSHPQQYILLECITHTAVSGSYLLILSCSIIDRNTRCFIMLAFLHLHQSYQHFDDQYSQQLTYCILLLKCQGFWDVCWYISSAKTTACFINVSLEKFVLKLSDDGVSWYLLHSLSWFIVSFHFPCCLLMFLLSVGG